MTRWRIVALGGLLVCGAAATFACITGSGPAVKVNCYTGTDPQACLCEPAQQAVADAQACPSANAPSDTVCCASTYYPSAGGSCTCDREPVGCTFDDVSGCTCSIVAVDAGTVPSCTPATQWASCCKSSTGCECTLDPHATCNGTVVASCSKSDADGGFCGMENGSCTCGATMITGLDACSAPSMVCCFRPQASFNGITACTCKIGTACQPNEQQVSSCTPSMVADAAIHDWCSVTKLPGIKVSSCNPPPDGG